MEEGARRGDYRLLMSGRGRGGERESTCGRGGVMSRKGAREKGVGLGKQNELIAELAIFCTNCDFWGMHVNTLILKRLIIIKALLSGV